MAEDEVGECGSRNSTVRLLTLLSVAGLGVATYFGLRAHTVLARAPQTEYGFVIDAGSHGSRIQLYQWPERLHDPLHPLRGPVTYPEQVWQYNTAPGISSSVYTPDTAAQERIAPLVEAAKVELTRRAIDEGRWSEFPIYLKATAGMRDVGITTRGQLMWNVRDFLSDPKNNPFRFHPDWARVTAGEEEGVYGWLTVNKLQGLLDEPASETVGSLDMGGASTQITFFPVHTSVMEDYYAVVLGNRLLRLYSHSYLGFGHGDSLMRLTTRLGVELVLQHLAEYGTPTNTSDPNIGLPNIVDKPEQETLSNARPVILKGVHPCYPKGYTFKAEMPSLAYPDGRFYVDINYEHMVEYMKAIGLPKKALAEAKTRAFMDEPSEGSSRRQLMKFDSDGEDDSDDDEDLEELHEDHSEHIKGDLPQRPGSDKDAKETTEKTKHADKENETSMEDDANTEEKEKKQSSDDEDHSDEESVIHGDLPQRPGTEHFENVQDEPIGPLLTIPNNPENVMADPSSFRETKKKKKEKKEKKDKRHTNYAGVVLQDKSSLHGGNGNGPFNALSGGGAGVLNEQKYAYTIEFEGGSNFEECHARATDLFFEAPCFIHSCSFNSVYQPRLEGSKFLAFGQYSKVHTALGLKDNDPLNLLHAATERVCAMSKSALRSERRKGNFSPYGKNGVMKLCWKATWAHAFLTEALKFPSNSTAITFVQSVGEGLEAQAPGWGLGSMIVEVNYFPWKTPIGRYQLPFLLALGSGVILAVLSLVLCMHVELLRKLYHSAVPATGAYQPLA